MLIATITALVLLFGGAADVAGNKATITALQALAASHVTEDSRRDQVAAVLAEMSTELDAFEARRRELHARIFQVDANYDATADEFREVFAEIHDNWKGTERRLVDLRFRMRDLTTREEWEAMFAELREQRKDG